MNLVKMENMYCHDLMDALKFWDSKPLLKAYFPSEREEIEMSSFELELKRTIKRSITGDDARDLFKLDESKMN